MASIKQVQVNSITYDINDKDIVFLYKQEEDDTLYMDDAYTTELTVSGFQSLLVSENKKKLWVVSNNYGASPALYAYGLDQNDDLESAGIRFIGLEGTAELLSFVCMDTSDPSNTFTCSKDTFGEDCFDFMFTEQISGGVTESVGYLELSGPNSILYNSAIADALASGDASQIQYIWTILLALMTGVTEGAPGLGHKKFTYQYQSDNDNPDGLTIKGTSAYISVFMKCLYDYSLDTLTSLEYAVVSEPFYDEVAGKWKTASFALSQNQTLGDKFQFDVTISNFSAGGGTVELYAEPVDDQTYPDLDGYYVLNPPVAISAIKQAMADGNIVRLNFTDPNSNEWSHLDLIDFNEGGTTQIFYTSPYQITPGGNFITACIVPNDIAYTSDIDVLVQFAFPTVSYAASAGSASYTPNADSLQQRIWYATCSTSAGTVAKEATVQRNAGTFTLQTGTIVFVNFTYANTSSSFTNISLNVNNTGAKGIKYCRASSTAMSASTNLLAAGQIIKGINMFMYDGTYWLLLSTNTDNYVHQANTTTSSNYRVLFSNGANDSGETAQTRKSGNLTFNPSTGALSVTGTVAASGAITSRGNQVYTVGDGLLWADNTGEDAEMLADAVTIMGYNGVSIQGDSSGVSIQGDTGITISTPANQDESVSISSDYISLTSSQYGGEIAIDDTGVVIHHTTLPLYLGGYDIEIFAAGGSGITVENNDDITLVSYSDVDFNVDGAFNYNGKEVATQDWVTNMVIGAIEASYGGGGSLETVTISYSIESYHQAHIYYCDGTGTLQTVVTTGSGTAETGSITVVKNTLIIVESYSEDGESFSGLTPSVTMYGDYGMGHEYYACFVTANSSITISL